MSATENNTSATTSRVLDENEDILSDGSILSDAISNTDEEYDSDYDQEKYDKMINYIEKVWRTNESLVTTAKDDGERKKRWQTWQRIRFLLSADNAKRKKRKTAVEEATDVKESVDETHYEREFREKLNEINHLRDVNNLLIGELQAATALINKEKKGLENLPIEGQLEKKTNEVLSLNIDFQIIDILKRKPSGEDIGKESKKMLTKEESMLEETTEYEHFTETFNKILPGKRQNEIKEFDRELQQITKSTELQIKRCNIELQKLMKSIRGNFKKSNVMESSKLKKSPNTSDVRTDKPNSLEKMKPMQREIRQLKTIRDEIKTKVFNMLKCNHDMKCDIKLLLTNKKRLKETLNKKYNIIITHENVVEQIKSKRDKMRERYTNYMAIKNNTQCIVEQSKEAERKLGEADDEIAVLEAAIEVQEKMSREIDEKTRSLDIECQGLQEFLWGGVNVLTDALAVGTLLNGNTEDKTAKFSKKDMDLKKSELHRLKKCDLKTPDIIELKKTRRHNLVVFLLELLNFGNDGALQRISPFEELAGSMLCWGKEGKKEE